MQNDKKEEYNNVYERDADFDDVDDIGNTEIKINPDFYIHSALVKAQKCMLKDDINAGFLSYVFFINHIENLCLAAKKIGTEYEKDIKEFREELKKDNSKRVHPLADDVKIADHKLRIIMQAVFDNKTLSDTLKTA